MGRTAKSILSVVTYPLFSSLFFVGTLAVGVRDLIGGASDTFRLFLEYVPFPLSIVPPLHPALAFLLILLSMAFAIAAVFQACKALLTSALLTPLLAFTGGLALLSADVFLVRSIWHFGYPAFWIPGLPLAWTLLSLAGDCFGLAFDKPVAAPLSTVPAPRLPSAPLLDWIDAQKAAERAKNDAERRAQSRAAASEGLTGPSLVTEAEVRALREEAAYLKSISRLPMRYRMYHY